MTIKITLQQNGKSIRREYRTHKRAISAMKRWFESNDGIAVVYQPGKLPAVYRNQHELPHQELQKKTHLYHTKA